jgi:hypothetical protein
MNPLHYVEDSPFGLAQNEKDYLKKVKYDSN